MTERALIHRELVRQTALLFFVFALLFALLGAGVYSMVSSNIYRNADENLQAIGMESDYITLDAAGSGSAIVDDVVVEEPDGAAPSDATAIDDLSLTLQQSIVDADPQFITLIRNEQGDLLETVGLYASYPSFLRHIPFDKNDLERVYQIAAGGHEYRGITYAASDEGETTYLQTLVNVDSEIAILDGFTRTLIVYLAAAVVVAAGASYLLSRRTLKPIVANMRAQTEFVQNASHELRTPLAVIKAECEYALSDNASEEDMLEALSSIDEQTDKMTKLVTALLTLSRTEQGDKRYKLEDTDLSELVKKTCADFVLAKNITLTADIEDNIIIPAQAQLISLMLENLLSNAVKYGRDGGHIEVRLKKDNGIVLSVKDDGIGIKEEDLPKIWGRFYRADESRSRESGFGLGLSLVSQIAALHGGKVSASSVYGEGSEFTVTF